MLANGKKKLILRYLLTPQEFITNEEGTKLQGMAFSQNKLEGAMNEQRAVGDESLGPVNIDADIVIKSIGYKSLPVTGVPFDHRKSIIPHDFGCVADPEKGNEIIPGLYVAGWAKRGPVGIIDATLRDTKETFGVLKHHLESAMLSEKTTSLDEIAQILPEAHVTFKNWLKVDQEEVQKGAELNKVREKILDRSEMIDKAIK